LSPPIARFALLFARFAVRKFNRKVRKGLSQRTQMAICQIGNFSTRVPYVGKIHCVQRKKQTTMGKPTGFLEFTRALPGKLPVEARKQHYRDCALCGKKKSLNENYHHG